MSPLSWVSVSVGAVIVSLTLVDLFKTVFVVGGGAGLQSGRVADWAWRLALRLHDPQSRASHSRLRLVGPLILVTALLVWVAELTVGWALVFVPEAFADRAGFVDRLAFAAEAVVGRGGNRPPLELAGGGWEMLRVPAGLTGITVLSLGLAYVLPILAAVAHKRSIGASIHTLGGSVEEMRRLATQTRGGSFELHLIGLTGLIAHCAERHRSYPVLHYFHSDDVHAALPPSVAKLSLLLRDSLPGNPAVDPTVLFPLSRAVRDLLEAVGELGLERYVEAHPEIDGDEMDEVGMDPQSEGGGAEGFPSEDWLRAYVDFDGWEWDDLIGEGARSEV